MFSAGWGVGVGWGRGDEKEAGDIKTAPCLDRLGGACAQPLATSFILNSSFQDRRQTDWTGLDVGADHVAHKSSLLAVFMAETVG